jgi:hypothetical protein
MQPISQQDIIDKYTVFKKKYLLYSCYLLHSCC